MLLDVLEQQLVIFGRAEVPDYEMMQGVMEYFLDYPDLYHHPTEDLILSKMETRGWTAKDGFPDFRHEHQALATMTRRISTAIQDILQEVEMPREVFQQRARVLGFLSIAYQEGGGDLLSRGAKGADKGGLG